MAIDSWQFPCDAARIFEHVLLEQWDTLVKVLLFPDKAQIEDADFAGGGTWHTLFDSVLLCFSRDEKPTSMISYGAKICISKMEPSNTMLMSLKSQDSKSKRLAGVGEWWQSLSQENIARPAYPTREGEAGYPTINHGGWSIHKNMEKLAWINSSIRVRSHSVFSRILRYSAWYASLRKRLGAVIRNVTRLLVLSRGYQIRCGIREEQPVRLMLLEWSNHLVWNVAGLQSVYGRDDDNNKGRGIPIIKQVDS